MQKAHTESILKKSNFIEKLIYGIYLNQKKREEGRNLARTKEVCIDEIDGYFLYSNEKYEKLISALKNRGYPVEEVYSKDVMWFETESLLKPSTPVRRSSSMGKNPFDLSSSSSITDDNNI